MRILPISPVSNFKNTIFNSSKIQSNLLINANMKDTVSFTGVKENKKEKQFSYKPETRKAVSYLDDFLYDDAEKILSKLDSKTNEIIKIANNVGKEAESAKSDITGVYKKNAKCNFKCSNDTQNIKLTKNDKICIYGIVDKRSGRVEQIKTAQIDKDGEKFVNTYKFNKQGQVIECDLTNEYGNTTLKLSYNEINYVQQTNKKTRKTIGQINFDKKDNIEYAGFAEEKCPNGDRCKERVIYEKKFISPTETLLSRRDNTGCMSAMRIQYK